VSCSYQAFFAFLCCADIRLCVHRGGVRASSSATSGKKSRELQRINSCSIFPDYTETTRRIGFPDSLSREHRSHVPSLSPVISLDRLKRSAAFTSLLSADTFISPVASFALFTLLNYPISISPLLPTDHHLARRWLEFFH